MKKVILVTKQEGFTLIELMIVVGIIGILVAIAAPNFSRYQSKARQSEAKIALAAVYGGEKSFYSEYAAYIAGMDAIGYTPEGAKRFYSVGWSAATTSNTQIAGFSGSPGAASYARTNFPGTWTTCTPSLTAATPAAATTDPQAFIVVASGQIRDAQACDVWQIDETKILQNTTTSL